MVRVYDEIDFLEAVLEIKKLQVSQVTFLRQFAKAM